MQEDSKIVVKYIHDMMEANNTVDALQTDSWKRWENRKSSRVTFTTKHGTIQHVSARKKSCDGSGSTREQRRYCDDEKYSKPYDMMAGMDNLISICTRDKSALLGTLAPSI
jgi:hypothetical protein